MDLSSLGKHLTIEGITYYEKCPFCGGVLSFKLNGKTFLDCDRCGFFGFVEDLEEAIRNHNSGQFVVPTHDTPDGLIDIGEYVEPNTKITRIPTGISVIDDTLNGLASGLVTVVTGATGQGKCFARGTKIVMYSGELRSVEDVKGGDLLMGEDSTPRKVLGISNGVGEMYSVSQNKAMSYTVNAQHVLCLKKRDYLRNPRKPSSPEEACEMSVSQYLELSDRERLNLKGYRVAVDFPENPVPIDPYFLGVWLGDGACSTLRITTSDCEIVDYIHSYAKKFNQSVTFVCDNGKAKTYGIKGTRGMYSKGRGEILEEFQKLDLINNKHIPNNYLYNSKEVRFNLLAGILDTDGYLTCNGYEIVQKNRNLAMGIQYLANSLGLRCIFKKINKTCCNNGKVGVYYISIISGNTHEIPVKVERRKIKSYSKTSDPMITGISISSVGAGEYFGFEVDGNHKFLLEDFTVTHNSTFVSQIALNVIDAGYKVGFYSGELPVRMFQSWLFCQAAGANNLRSEINEIGVLEHKATIAAESRIRPWLQGKLYLSDNKKARSNEQEIIFQRFQKARHIKGCELFVIDNLMACKMSSQNERDFYRQQGAFTASCVQFALENSCHVLLVAHPRKSNGSENVNESISGTSDIANQAANILRIDRATDKEKLEMNNIDSVLTISKNRENGLLGRTGFYFDGASKRFTAAKGETKQHFEWEL